MKVLLANPPTYAGKGTFNRPIRFPTYQYATPVMHPPLLLLYAAAYLRSRGHQATFIDAQVDTVGVAEFVAKVKEIAPDYLVCETSTPSFHNDVRVAEEVKTQVGTKIIFVGTHVSALPTQSLEGNQLDAVIVGEYEVSLAEYIETGADGIKGVCYRNGKGEIVFHGRREYLSELDALPFPARDLIPNYKYFDPILKNPFTFVLGGRGCPFQCTFCDWPQVLTGRNYRRRTPGNIVDELEVLRQNYHFKSFLFNDDTFTADRRFTLAVCDEIIRRKIDLPWGCYSRADNDDVAMLTRLREAGCFLLKVGVESGDQKILDQARKHYKLEDVVRGVRTMMGLGFDVHCTFVFGLPGETKQTINTTIEFAKKLCPTTVQFSTAVPYPGTELHQYLKDQGYLLTENWDDYMPMQSLFQYPHLSPQDMRAAVKKAYRQYYFRPAYIKTGLEQLFTRPATVISNVRKLIRLSV